jgi:pilus assembly protein FimV
MGRFHWILVVAASLAMIASGCGAGGAMDEREGDVQFPASAAGHGGMNAPGVAGAGVAGGGAGSPLDMGRGGPSGVAGAAGMPRGHAGSSPGTAGGGMDGASGTDGGSGAGAASGTGGTSGRAGASGTSGGGSTSGASGASGAAGASGTAGAMPAPAYAPSPDNPAECPAVAPENPVGDCLGLPVYLVCEYGDDTYWYVCTCDWFHWLCAGT